MRRLLLAVLFALAPVVARAAGAITLVATTDSLELVTTTTATTDFRCSWVDNTATTFTPGLSAGQITTATTTTIVAAPAASTQRKISGCSVYVAGNQTVTVQLDQSATNRPIFKATLTAADWSLQWNEESRFQVYDNTGATVADTTQPVSGTVTADTELPAGSTPADNESNAVTIPRIGSFTFVFDGTTWDRWTGAVTANAGTNLNTSALFLDATFTGRMPAGASPADAESNTNTALSRIGTFMFGYDGTDWNRVRVDSTSFRIETEIEGGAGAPVTAFPDNEPFNVAQWNGVAPTAAAAAADNFSNPTFPPIGAFNMLFDGTNWDRWPGDSTNGAEVQVTVFPDNEPFNQNQRGGVAVVAGACERETLLYVQINQVTGTQLITGTASERIYICAIQLMTATAQNVALVDGTGSVCATSPTGLLGGSTAATGWNFAANGGIVLPPTRDSWTKTSTDADNVCLLQSGAGQVSGSLTYISIPNI